MRPSEPSVQKLTAARIKAPHQCAINAKQCYSTRMTPIILASTSPRRRELLERMGLAFTVIPSNYHERLDDTRSVQAVAKELGLGKAMAVAADHPEAIVIGSDTIVALGRRQLGKAASEAEARQMLREQAGNIVTIISSVAVVWLDQGVQEVHAAHATALLKPYNAATVNTYLTSGDWRDKAGAWGMQSGAGPLIAYYQGDTTTVIGLPTALLAGMLQRFGIASTPVDYHVPVRQLQDTNTH